MRYAKCAIIGGLIVFCWMMFSWMVLPWHRDSMQSFKHPTEVVSCLRDNASQDGAYMMCCEGNNPSVALSVRWEKRSMAQYFVTGFVIQMVGALGIAWLLFQTKGLRAKEQAVFTCVAGLVVGILGFLPQWNWAALPLSHAFLGIIDLAIGWFLAGLAMAKLAK